MEQLARTIWSIQIHRLLTQNVRLIITEFEWDFKASFSFMYHYHADWAIGPRNFWNSQDLGLHFFPCKHRRQFPAFLLLHINCMKGQSDFPLTIWHPRVLRPATGRVDSRNKVTVGWRRRSHRCPRPVYLKRRQVTPRVTWPGHTHAHAHRLFTTFRQREPENFAEKPIGWLPPASPSYWLSKT